MSPELRGELESRRESYAAQSRRAADEAQLLRGEASAKDAAALRLSLMAEELKKLLGEGSQE